MSSLIQAAAQIEPELIEIRRHFHQYPELSLEEKETSSRVAQQLEKLGLTVKTNVGGYGVVADLHGDQPGPTLALRADMDALPIEEETELPFRSKRPGIMHACGHDAHTAILLGAAKLLVARKEQIKGTVRFIFQSAEEINDGAKRMVAEGVLEGVDEIYGLHNLPTLPAGKVATRYGSLMGSVDRIEIELEGKGGHGAMPDQSIDPVLAASAIVMGLQSAVSREISPFEPAVVTIGSLNAGIANNVIPQRAYMSGTIRTFAKPVQAEMEARIRRLVTEIASAYRCKADLDYIEQVPVLVSTDTCVKHVEQTVEKLLGPDKRVEAAPTMAGEDFSIYLEQVPGCFFWLGSGPQEQAEQAYGLHHPKYNLNEDCLKTGAAVMAEIVLQRGQLA